jgi:amino acid adenylation domain-containing protein
MEFRASYHQERLWFIDRFETGHVYETNPIYHNIPLIFRLNGVIDKDMLEKSIKAVIHRHGALRTRVITRDSAPLQVVDQETAFKLEYLDLTGYSGENPEKHARDLAIVFAKQPFKLDSGPLIRAQLIQISTNDFILVLGIHHIIADRYSLKIMAREIFSNYKAFLRGESPGLPALSAHYPDFSQWQHGFSDEVLETILFYWKKKLQGKPQSLELPTDRPRAPIHVFHEQSRQFEINSDLFAKIENFCRQNNTNKSLLLLAAFKILLYRYSNQEEIVVGTSDENRNQPGLEHIVGPIANLLVLRSVLDEKSDFLRVLEHLEETVAEARKYKDIPFERLDLELKTDKDMSRLVFFDVLFQYEDNPVKVISADNLGVKILETNLGYGKYDLHLLLQEGVDSIRGFLVYNSDYYNDSTISRFIDHYIVLLESILRDPTKEISKQSFLTGEERRRILMEWNQTRVNYPGNKTIHQLFEEQVEKNPDNIALIDPGHQGQGAGTGAGTRGSTYRRVFLTYRELNRKVNRLAHYLRRNYNVGPDMIVGIMMEPGLDLMIGILGILTAGGAYLPLDYAHPEQRIVSILDDSRASLLLTTAGDIKERSFTRLAGTGTHTDPPGSQPYLTGPRARITDLDGLPFPNRALVDYEKYNQYIGQAAVKYSISLLATRGCPYNCAYCHKIWPKKQMVRSAENIFAELRLYYDIGIRRFAFIDDIFNLDVKNSTDFFRLIIKNGLDVQLFFPNGIRGDLLTKDYIDLMVEAGTTGLALALETPSQRLQKLIGKNLNIPRLKENLEYFCTKYPNIILELFTMHGFPTETEEEAYQTLDFIKSLHWLHFPYINILRIFPHTDMEKLALESGISRGVILNQTDLTQNDWADTLPFEKKFTFNYQNTFLQEYFLLKERILHVLPYQMSVLSDDEMVQKYNSILGTEMTCLDDLLGMVGITKEQLGSHSCAEDGLKSVPNLNQEIKKIFPVKEPVEKAFKVLLLDTSQEFSSTGRLIYDVVEPPLGLMYLISALYKEFGNKIAGKIAKSRIDFDNFHELNALLDEFKPDIIGIRSLTVFKDLFHRAASMVKHWRFNVPVIAGGPYATSDYHSILHDGNIDLVVLGEGETTFCEIVAAVMENEGRLPDEKGLAEIKGIAFLPAVPVGGKLQKDFDRRIILSDELTGQLPEEWDKNPAHLNQPPDLSYIIYTSGTTGKPKGVLIEHRNVVRLLFNDAFQFDFDHTDTWTLFHSYCFDFSVWEMYGALLYGGKLAVIPKIMARDTGMFLERLLDEQVTVLNQTPTAFYRLIDEELKKKKAGLALRYVIFGGEALNPGQLAKWKTRYPGTRLINMYGTTETTVHVTYKEITAQEIDLALSNIGKPIPTLVGYVLDREMNLVPIGVAGELYVGGDGVGRGYLNRLHLTEEKFVDSIPFLKGQKLYRTGDLVRLADNGEMIYLDRIDNQVKIRGHRIELGEIENQLINLQETKEINNKFYTIYIIKSAVVIVRQNKSGDKYLCAYFVMNPSIPPDVHQAFTQSPSRALKDHLAKRLPDYMIPSFFVMLDHIPLSDNGKVNRSALPEPEIESGDEFIAPRNEVERAIAHILCDVLGIDYFKISARANLFDLGVNSITLAKIAHRISTELNTHIQISTLFTKPTIEEIVEDMQKNYTPTTKKQPILLNRGGAPRNMFLMSGDGVVFGMKDLARALAGHFNIYGIQARGILDKGTLPETREELCEEYYQEIKMIQPEGPYLLGGHCFGSVISYDLTRIMEDRGDKVDKIIFFDEPAIMNPINLNFMILNKIYYITQKVKRFFKTLLEKKKEKVEDDTTPGLPEDLEARRLEVQTNFRRLYRSVYCYWRIIHTPILVLKGTETDSPQDIRWRPDIISKISTQPVEVVETPGDHFTIFDPTNAEVMARHILEKV